MVSAFVSGSRSLGSSPGLGHYVVLLGEDTLLSQCLSPPRAGLFKAPLSSPRICENFDLSPFGNFSVRLNSVYIVCPSVLTWNNLKLHKT